MRDGEGASAAGFASQPRSLLSLFFSHQDGVLKVGVHKDGPIRQRVGQVGAPEVGGGHDGLDQVGACGEWGREGGVR